MKRCFILTITLSMFFILLFFQNAPLAGDGKRDPVTLELREDTGNLGYFGGIHVWNGRRQMVRIVYLKITHPHGTGLMQIYEDYNYHLIEPLTATIIDIPSLAVPIPTAPCTASAYYEVVPNKTQSEPYGE